MLSTFSGVLKSGKVLSLPRQYGTLISVRMTAFERDNHPILDTSGNLTEAMVEFPCDAIALLLQKNVVQRASILLEAPKRRRTLVFGKYPTHVVVEGLPEETGEGIIRLNAAKILKAEDPTFQNELPSLIRTELAILQKCRKPSKLEPAGTEPEVEPEVAENETEPSAD